jgi:hypothetical protein
MLKLFLDIKLACTLLPAAVIIGYAFYGDPWLMLDIIAVVVLLCVPLWWWAAPKKAPRPRD